MPNLTGNLIIVRKHPKASSDRFKIPTSAADKWKALNRVHPLLHAGATKSETRASHLGSLASLRLRRLWIITTTIILDGNISKLISGGTSQSGLSRSFDSFNWDSQSIERAHQKKRGGPSLPPSMATSRAMSGISGNKCTLNSIISWPAISALQWSFVCPSASLVPGQPKAAIWLQGRPKLGLTPQLCKIAMQRSARR